LSGQLFILLRLFVLAVLLSPRDFGLFGMAVLAQLALDTLTKTGFEQALIQKKEEITPYLEVAWTVRFIRGLLVGIVFFGSAPWFSAFFGEPAATPLMRTLSLTFVFNGLTNIGVVYFQKKLEFHKEFAFRFSGILVDMVVAITAAYFLRNAMAFILGLVAGDLTRLVVSYLIHPFRPRFRLDWIKTRELLDYGMWVFFFGITVFVGYNGAGVIIGKIIGATALGYFQTAQRIPNIVVRQLGETIGGVAFPAYAELQSSVDSLRAAYQRIAGFTATLLIPAAVGIMCIGQDFIQIFLGPKWVPMIPALLILSMASLVGSILWTGRPVFMGGGRPQVAFHMQLMIAGTVFLCIYPLSSRWGIIGASVAMVLSNASALVVWYVNMRRLVGVTWREIALLFTPPLIASIFMAGVLYGLRVLTLPMLPGPRVWDILWFLCMVLFGGAAYFALILIFQRLLPNYRPLEGIAEALRE
jgi:O-antigen/teichoic acid export membrane protein